MHFSRLDLFLWAAIFVGELLTLLVLFLRHRARSFPLFTTLIAVLAITEPIKYFVALHFSLHTYGDTYRLITVINETLELFVIYEIAVHVFCPTGVWARDVRRTFLGMSAVSVVVAFLLAWLAHPATLRFVTTMVLRIDFFSAALMSELFVGMVVLSATSGLPWKTHVARVAQGMGAWALTCVAVDIVTNYVGTADMVHVHLHLGHILNITWIACEAYWIVMLWADAPAPRELPETMRNQIYTLQRQVENDLIRIRAWRRS